jgi:hypothetical protein
MDILNILKQLRDDIKIWVTNNINALNAKIDEKTIPIDNELNSTSTNPVQNQAIAKEIDSINDRVGNTPVATQISQAINAQEHFSGDYNDLTNAPDITDDGSDNMVITDEAGNIIFKADADGIHTTAVSIDGEAAATEKYVDDAVANIDIPEVDFTGYATEEYVAEEIAKIPQTDLTDYATKKYVDDVVDGIKIPEVDFTGYATETYVDNKVADLVNSAPEALDTLGELATALDVHEDAYDALLETVGSKATHTDLENLKEELSESIVAETDEWKVVDENGNIIFSVDATGAHTTSMTLNGQSVKDMIDDKVDKVDGKGLSTNDFTDEYKTKLDSLENIEFEETDPTVPAWAKEENKPSYTADEVGALADTTVLADLTDDATHRTVTDTEKQAWNAKSNFSGDYNDLENAPDISEDGSGDLIIADKDGNIIFRSNGTGFETVNLIVQNITVNGMTIQEMIKAYVDETILGGEW